MARSLSSLSIFGLTSKLGYDLVELFELIAEYAVDVASQDGCDFKVIVSTLMFECLDADDDGVLGEKQFREDSLISVVESGRKSSCSADNASEQCPSDSSLGKRKSMRVGNGVSDCER